MVQSRIADINKEIARLQAELHQLELGLVVAIVDLKADTRSKLKLYSQAKELDRESHLLEERKQILENGI